MTVLARKSGLSSKEWFIKAQQIEVEAARLAHKESVVPKSYRFTFGVPMCEVSRSIVANIERADAMYPNTSWGVIERKKYLALAMADGNTLYDLIACLIEVREGPRKKKEADGEDAEDCGEAEKPKKTAGVNLNELRELLEVIDGEINLLQSVKNGVKLIGKESAEDKLAAAEAEAQRLRDIVTMQEEVRL